MQLTARDYALIQLDRARLPGWPSRLIRGSGPPPQDPRDLALAEQIRMGAIKNFGLLHHSISHYAKGSKVDPLVHKILAIGLYQLRFLDRIPPSAAVDQAVEQTRRFGRKHAAGFVNAILRRATREPDVPLPDRSSDPLGYAQIALSHPEALVHLLAERHGTETMLALCEHDNREPPTLLRLFRGVTQDRLAQPGVTLSPHEQAGMVVADGARRSALAEWARSGVAQVQDATAAAVAVHLALAPGLDVLDRCAGMGTKTLQIQDELAGTGWVMAIEPSEDRCNALRELIQSRRITNVALLQARMLKEISELKRPAFDRILVDVPCSNSGVIARRPEARFSQDAKSLESLMELQDQILDDSAPYLRPGGLMVYSTCSIWPSENQQRVDRFVTSHSQFEQIHVQSTLPRSGESPSVYRDGGFVAVLQRRL